jgi:hypothetical protein
MDEVIGIRSLIVRRITTHVADQRIQRVVANPNRPQRINLSAHSQPGLSRPREKFSVRFLAAKRKHGLVRPRVALFQPTLKDRPQFAIGPILTEIGRDIPGWIRVRSRSHARLYRRRWNCRRSDRTLTKPTAQNQKPSDKESGKQETGRERGDIGKSISH